METRGMEPAGAGEERKRGARRATPAAAGGQTPGPRAGARRGTGPDLHRDLRSFVRQHPQGWGHEEWLELLEQLRRRDHGELDPEEVGSTLERVRLSLVLEGIPGVGAQRVRALAERYGTIWHLRQADVDELTTAARIPRPLAEAIRDAL